MDSPIPMFVLDLDGETIEVGSGYWVAMRFRRVEPEAGRPHGLSYALTLHAPSGRRVLGFDNAHPIRKQGNSPAWKSFQPTAYDHFHRDGVVQPYEFKSPVELLEDFWMEVERYLKLEGVR